MQNLAELNRKHAIVGVAEVVVANGLPAVRVTAGAHGLVYLHGSHVAEWKPAGAEEVLWMSGKSLFQPDRPIRGGVPVCFPWFGPLSGSPSAPAHGFARSRAWELESIQRGPAGVAVVLKLAADDATRAAWPHDFVLRLGVTFGPQLVMRLEMTNSGQTPLKAEEALHTYFTVGDVRQARVKGLDGVRYIDKVDGRKEKTQSGEIVIVGETDRVYLDTHATVVIEDPVLRRRIIVAKEGSRDTVVWNPWIAKAKAMADFGDDEWPGMICVETCNVGASAVDVAPGVSITMTARISVQDL